MANFNICRHFWRISFGAVVLMVVFVARGDGAPLSRMVDDFVVFSTQDRQLVFATGEADGVIYSALLNDRGSASYDDLQVFYKSEVFKNPSAVAIHGNALIFCDRNARAVVSIDIESKKERILYRNVSSTPFEPVSVTVDESGMIFIADDRFNQVYRLMPSGEPQLLPIIATGHEPNRLIPVDSNILVFSRDLEYFYSAPAKLAELNTVSQKRGTMAHVLENFISQESKRRLGRVNDVAYVDGTFFLVSDRGLFQFRHAKEKVDSLTLDQSYLLDPVPVTPFEGQRISRIRSSKRKVFVANDSIREFISIEPPLNHRTVSRLYVRSDLAHWSDGKNIFSNKLQDGTLLSFPDRVSGVQKLERRYRLDNMGGQLPIRDFAVSDSNDVFSIRENAVWNEGSDSSRPQRAYAGEHLIKPVSVVSVGSQLYVVDDQKKRIVRLDIASRRVTPEYEAKTVEFPNRLLAAKKFLLGIDNANKKVFKFSLKPPISLPRESESRDWEVDDGEKTFDGGEVIDLKGMVETISDVTVANDTLYVLDSHSRRLILLSLTNKEVTFLDYKEFAKYPSVLASDDRYVYLFDEYNNSISLLPTMVPINIYFEGRWASDSLVKLYKYLQRVNLLPLKAVKATDNTTIDKILSEENLLMFGYKKDFSQILCKLNAFLCKGVGSSLTQGLVHEGQVIQIPNLQIRTYNATRFLRLPLSPKVYPPQRFGDLYGKSLLQIAQAFSRSEPDGRVKESLTKLNPYFKGDDIGAATEGEFSIPVFSMQLRLAVPKRDVDNPISELSQLVNTVNVFSSTSSLTSNSFPEPRFSNSELFRDSVDEKCTDFPDTLVSGAMKAIHHCFPVGLPTGLTVGVIEKTSFDKNNVVFQDGGSPGIRLFKDDFAAPTTSLPRDASKFDEPRDHATHVAAIIAGRRTNAEFIGINPRANIYGVDFANAKPAIDSDANSIRLFNVSIGEPQDTKCELSDNSTALLRQLVQEDVNRLFVISANNRGCNLAKNVNALASLGYAENVIVVGAAATSNMSSKLPFSSYGSPTVSIMAPGDQIKSALAGGGMGVADGTSQATAFVTGAASIIMQKNRELKPWQVKIRIMSTADIWSTDDISGQVFSGSLNVDRAVRFLNFVTIKTARDGPLCVGNIDDLGQRARFTIKPDRIETRVSHVLRVVRNIDGSFSIFTKIKNKPEMERTLNVSGEKLDSTFSFISSTPDVCTSRIYDFTEIYDFVNQISPL